MGYIFEKSERFDFKKIKSSYKESDNSNEHLSVSLQHFNIYKNRNNIREISRNQLSGDLEYSKAVYMQRMYNALSEFKYADIIPFIYYRNGIVGVVDDSCKFSALRFNDNSSENGGRVCRYEYSGR